MDVMLLFILRSMSKSKQIKEVTIEKGRVLLNGNSFFEGEQYEIGSFLKSLYKHLGLKYGKFFKMDYLSKLGLLASEILLKDVDVIKQETDEVALVFANASSSLNTDVKYQESIAEIPSPAVFVYTLPNIVIGEISIKNKFYGEHMFFIQQQYDKEFLVKYAESLFETTQTKYAIVGRLEVDIYGNYKAQLILRLKNNY